MFPEAFFRSLKNRIKKEWIFTFLSAFILGLLIHLFRLTNHLLTWDSVYNLHSDQNAIHLGRCFLTLFCGIGSYYDLQWINGLLSIIYISLTCVCLTVLFKLQKKSSILLICGLTVSFPTVASTFAYMYTADGYFLAMLFMTLAVVITINRKWGFLPGLFLIASAYGSYQAYISYAVMLILVWSILVLLFEEHSIKELAVYWLRFLAMGGLGTLLYLICNKILTVMEGITASDYNGISTMSFPNGQTLVFAIKECIIDFVYFFFGPLDHITFYQISNGFMLFVLGILIVWIFIKYRLYQDFGRMALIILCLMAMPFVCSMIYFLSPQVRYYMLMYMSFSMLYILPVLLYDRISSTEGKANLFFSWICVIFAALQIFNFALISNISYLYMKTSNEKTFALTGRMVDRIEHLEDTSSLKKLCLIGHFDDFDTISLSIPPAMAGIRDSYFISEPAHFAAMMKDYFGLTLEGCTREEQEKIGETPEVQEMGCWPESTSVQRVGDTVVIKIE